MLLAGGFIALQSQINGRLADHLGTGARAGFAAAMVSFGTGLVVLLVVTAVHAGHRARVAGLVATVRRGQLRPVELIGGCLGALLVASQGLTVGTLGVALFSVALTAGQSVTALAVDHLGIGPAGHQSVSVSRLIAAGFTVAAMVLATADRLSASLSWLLVLDAVLAFVAGCGSSVQQALNGRVARHVGPWVTTVNNFAVGTVVLLVAFALSLLAHGQLAGPPHTWWLYLGGLIGMTFIWLAAVLVRVYGVLVLGLSTIAGQVIGAEVIQAVVGHERVGASGYVASALTVVGVLIALGLRRTRRTLSG